jgi:hypothetical protein
MDWVLMATSLPVDSCLVPTPAISLSSEAVVFHYLALANVLIQGSFTYFV